MFVRHDDEALSLRTQYLSADKGVFFFDRQLCRGADPKFKVDSHVCIFEDTVQFENKGQKRPNEFKESEVLQIMGRSSRSQGQGKGTFYMIGNPIANPNAMSTIKGLSSLQDDE